MWWRRILGTRWSCYLYIFEPMKDFAAIDFETANEQRSSVCSVGVVVVRGGEIIDRFYSLIRPEPEYYSYWNTRVHGLTLEDTADAPVFACGRYSRCTAWITRSMFFIVPAGLPAVFSGLNCPTTSLRPWRPAAAMTSSTTTTPWPTPRPAPPLP